jgi:hypothetical protein
MERYHAVVTVVDQEDLAAREMCRSRTVIPCGAFDGSAGRHEFVIRHGETEFPELWRKRVWHPFYFFVNFMQDGRRVEAPEVRDYE